MKQIKIAFSILGIVLLFTMNMQGQSFNMNLYQDGAFPNYKDTGEEEVWDTTDIVRIKKVQTPDISVYLPSSVMRTGEAVIICPGGGYHILAYDKEGEDIAKFFNSKGIVGIVLKYRLPTSDAQIVPHKSSLMDAQRAMRLVRYHAEEWGIDPGKIGIMGFSAGGHLASSLSTHFDAGDSSSKDPVEQVSCRPDFSVLIYPVISFTADFQHKGSRKALAGEDPELMNYFSSELQVTPETPPAIMIHSSDDKAVPFRNSVVYYEALIKNGVQQSEMHIYPYGGHGFGLAIGEGHLSGWPYRVTEWIQHLLKN